jgi:PAS domain S-box-containing protein
MTRRGSQQAGTMSRRDERQLAEAQKLTHVGSWEWNLVTNEVTWSDELYRIFDVTRETFTPSYDAYLARVHPEDRASLHASIQSSLADRRPHRHEARIVRPDGTFRLIESHAEIVVDQDGGRVRMHGTCQDITERKQAEEALERIRAELEHRAATLERSNLELEQFAYDASHDLSEPLRMMSEVARRLGERYAGSLDQDGRRLIASIVDEAGRMQTLIDDMLDYARAAGQPLERAAVDCSALLQDTLELFAESIAEKDASVRCDPLPIVRGDARQLEHLFQNLLCNALKFTDSPPLDVHVGAKRERDAWRFWVRDNGIGIEPRHAERVFEMFRRLHPQDAYPGTGMGLSICKRIVERHGGRIWLEPGSGGGSVFYFTIADEPPG